MKKILFILFMIVLSGLCFALEGLSLSPTIGYGYILGQRQYKEDESSFCALNATGIEGGVIANTSIKDKLDIEAYFAYLFALNGGESSNKSESPKLQVIPSQMKYTDYKAGLGIKYSFGRTSLSAGIDFAGISNHTFSDSKQIRGRKTTSFGFYLRPSYSYPINKRISIFADILSCVNFTGWIREFDVEQQKWIDSFSKPANIFAITAFGRFGLQVKVL